MVQAASVYVYKKATKTLAHNLGQVGAVDAACPGQAGQCQVAVQICFFVLYTQSNDTKDLVFAVCGQGFIRTLASLRANKLFPCLKITYRQGPVRSQRTDKEGDVDY